MRYAYIALIALLITGCQTVYDQQHEAYSKMIDAKVKSKQISFEEGEYLKAQSKTKAAQSLSNAIGDAADTYTTTQAGGLYNRSNININRQNIAFDKEEMCRTKEIVL